VLGTGRGIRGLNRWVFSLVLGAVIVILAVVVSPSDQRAIIGLSGALVLVTMWYARQTQEMVREMQAARTALVQPKLAPTIGRGAGQVLMPKVVSVGSGPAFNVDIEVRLEPNGPSTRYATGVWRPGLAQGLILTEQATQTHVLDEQALEKYQELRVTGTCRDALGNPVQVDEAMDLTAFLAAWRAGLWVRTPKTERDKPPLDAIEEILDQIEHHIRVMVEPD
jgi:hypothetical protein